MPESLVERREFLHPLVDQWMQKIRMAEKAKEPFNVIARQCDSFFYQSSGFMWRDEFRKTYLGPGIAAPKFQVTINKAFELVALFGPYLFWRYPNVFIKNFDPVELSPDLFGDPNDRAVQQLFTSMQQEVAAGQSRQSARNSLMEKYLNYSQREQPGGGLAVHGELAITEALVKGRGCLWTEGYTFPGSGRTLTGRFYRSVDDLLIDPDAEDPMLRDAKWIALRHVTPVWELERKLDLPVGMLRDLGHYESGESAAANRGASARSRRVNGQTYDYIQWYEVWSRGGVGTRMRFVGDEGSRAWGEGLHREFENVVGDFAYLVITDRVPWPLNAPSRTIARSYDDDVRQMFQWRAAGYGPPFPCYLDDRWPVAVLDFYRKPKSAWPVAPLAPGLGELITLNILMSAFVEQAYENRKQIIAGLKSAAEQVQNALGSSHSPAFIEINEEVHKKVTDVVQYLNRPPMNNDIIGAIEYVSELFDKRTGLTEIMYAMNVGGKQSRTARDISVKEEKASIRPEKMSNDVARWMTESADLEKFLAGWIVEGGDLAPLLGRWGAYFWDQLIVAEDPEVFVREMRATVEANDVRRPNRERLAQNLQEMLQYTLPMLQQYAVDTGNTEPLNNFISKLGESMEQDVTGWHLGEWRPETDEEQQAQAALEKAKSESEVLIKKIEAQIKQVELDRATVEAAREVSTGDADTSQKQLELFFDRQKHEQDLGQDRNRFRQDLEQDRRKFLQDLLQKREENRVKLDQMRREARARESAKSNGSKA